MTKIERAKRPFVVTAEIEHLTDLLGGQEPAIQQGDSLNSHGL